MLPSAECRYPDLFHAVPSTSNPAILSTRQLAAIVISHASDFPETASRLLSVKDLPIPASSASASLIALQPRLNKLIAQQEIHAREVADLRSRTGVLLERWVQISLLGVGELWANVECRVADIEGAIRGLEAAEKGDPWKEVVAF